MQQPPQDDTKRVQKLQEKDSEVDAIVAHSKFAVAYYLHQDGNNPGWKKANLEGPVFIVRRKTHPRYQLWVTQSATGNVMQNLDTAPHLMDNLTAGWELDCQKNYVFYKVQEAQEKIRGLWFHDDTERLKMERALEETLDKIRNGEDRIVEPTKAPADAPAPFQASGNHMVQDQLYSQFGLRNTDQAASPDSVVVTKASLRQALHALVDDDNFLNDAMNKLKEKSSA